MHQPQIALLTVTVDNVMVGVGRAVMFKNAKALDVLDSVDIPRAAKCLACLRCDRCMVSEPVAVTARRKTRHCQSMSDKIGGLSAYVRTGGDAGSS